MSENGRNKDYYAGKQSGIQSERSRIIKRLEDEGSDVFSLIYLIALIKKESQNYNETVIHLTEGHNGGEHSACCNDWGCYGCENCEEGDCDDCSEGENDGS